MNTITYSCTCEKFHLGGWLLYRGTALGEIVPVKLRPHGDSGLFSEGCLFHGGLTYGIALGGSYFLHREEAEAAARAAIAARISELHAELARLQGIRYDQKEDAA